MTQSTAPKNGLNALLTPEDSVLVLIDHQPFQFANLNSHEPTMVVNNVIGLAKAAKIFNVPTILTTVVEDRGGKLIKGLQDVFPARSSSSRRSGRKSASPCRRSRRPGKATRFTPSPTPQGA